MTVRKRPALVVFQGGVAASSPLEGLVAQAQAAATLDLLATAASTGAFDRAILVTEVDALAGAAASEPHAAGGLPVIVEKPPTPPQAGGAFHFGESLLRVCQAHKLERVVYVGGGAMPLGASQDLADLALSVSGHGECVVANSL